MRRWLVLALGWLLLALPARADLDDDYRNRQEAVRLLQRATDGGLAADARLALYDDALALDPANQEGAFLKAALLEGQGRLTDAAAAYARCAAAGEANGTTLRAEAALVGICRTLKRPDDALFWASRLVVDDPCGAAAADALRQIAAIREAQGQVADAAFARARAAVLRGEEDPALLALQEKAQAAGAVAARMLFPPARPKKLVPRDTLSVLTAVTLPEPAITEPVTGLLADPTGRFLIALTRTARYYVIDLTSAPPVMRQVAAPAPLACATLADGAFYAVLDGPARLARLDLSTGQAQTVFPLEGTAPGSLAVFPGPQVACYPADGRIHCLNLLSGQVARTDLPGHAVAAHPHDDLLFVLATAEALPQPGLAAPPGEGQTTLLKALVLPGTLAPMAARVGAAVHGQQVAVSPDGAWVAVSGGGYRPVGDGREGHGTAVFASADIGVCQGYYPTGAALAGLAVNPVTAQMIAVTAQDARIYDLADPLRYVPLRGKGFSGAGAWSGDGQYLALAYAAGGLAFYANQLTDAEASRGAAWWKDVKGGGPFGTAPGPRPPARLPGQPEELARRFPQSVDRLATLALLDRALARVALPPLRWHAGALMSADTRVVLAHLAEKLRRRASRDELLAVLKPLLKAHPEELAGWYAAAEALRANGDGDAADNLFREIVRRDGGRTDLSILALQAIAERYLAEKKPLSALACLALAFDLDRYDAHTRALLLPLLASVNLPDYVAAVRRDLPLPRSERVRAAPVEGPATAAPLTAKTALLAAAPSLALVQGGDRLVLGVCLGRADLLLVDDAALSGADLIRVYPLSAAGGIVRRSEPVSAQYLRAAHGLALLRLREAAPGLRPLSIHASTSEIGGPVFAIVPGDPAAEQELTITAGVVAVFTKRTDATGWVQHTASVATRARGGLLLDAHGHALAFILDTRERTGTDYAAWVQAAAGLLSGE